MRENCRYVNPEGQVCHEKANEQGLCFWHDPSILKDGPDIKERLEVFAHSGRSMSGFILKGAELKGINLAWIPTGVNSPKDFL